MKRTIQLFAVLTIFMMVACGAQNSSTEAVKNTVSDEVAAQLDTAYFASGCFWCSEAVFERVKGVKDVVSGYSGGSKEDPTYREVSRGQTEYAESIRVLYDNDIISYRDLLRVFFGSHDPTQLNRQGPDVGKQYRSAIFYTSQKQKNAAEEIMAELNKSEYDGNIVTKITKFSGFYKAEGYHQGYYDAHPDVPYVKQVSKPKVEKFMKNYPEYLKEEYR